MLDKIFQINSDNTVKVFSGGGLSALGDGGPADSAVLRNPQGIVTRTGQKGCQNDQRKEIAILQSEIQRSKLQGDIQII